MWTEGDVRGQEVKPLWRRWECCALLVGMWVGVVSLCNRGKTSKEMKSTAPIRPSSLSFGHIPKEVKSALPKEMCIPMFMEALVTITKICKQSHWPLKDEWIKNLCHKYHKYVQWNRTQLLERMIFPQHGWAWSTLY